MIKKNTSGQYLTFVLIKIADGLILTGATPTGYVTIDAASQTGIGGAITETANGQYRVALSQGDTNGDEIGYLFIADTAVAVNIAITTETKKMADLNDLAVGAAMNLAANAIKKVSYDESTAYALESADTGASQIARTGADGDTLETLSDEIAAVPDAAAVNAQVDLALTDIHLDHLLAVEYDPAGKPGVATALLNELVESDAGVSRFTENSLENSPSGDATEAKQDIIITAVGNVPDAAAINAQCDASLETYHLDHLLHTAYDGEGAVGSLLEDLVEDNAGTFRFTEAALGEAPSGTGGDASAANQVLILEDIVDMKGTAFSKDTNSLVDICLSSELTTHDSKLDTVDANVDSILVDTGTTLDGKLDSILTDTGTTLDAIVDAILVDTATTIPGLLSTIDGVVDDIKKLLRGDFVVDENETPYEYLIKEEGTENVLLTKEMFETDDTNITAVTQVVGKMLKP